MRKNAKSAFLRIIAMFISLIIFAVPVFATSGANNEPEDISFFVNIYDEENSEFFLPNTEITVKDGTTLAESIEILKEKSLISDYVKIENSVDSITLLDGRMISVSPPPDTKLIYIKHNGSPVSTNDTNLFIRDGDILEWIYGPPIKNIVLPEDDVTSGGTATANGRVAPLIWLDEYQEALSDSCEFLNLNKDLETSYLVAMGTANKTLDVSIINNLLALVRRTQEYQTASALAKTVLSLSFAGYDASDLVAILSDYKGETDITAEDAIFMLIAYDCNKYAVSDDAVNSRRELVDVILASQGSDGGFNKASKISPSVSTTAMAISAISPYSDQARVQEATNSAITFLAENQTKEGEFKEDGVESTLALSKVIIGLVASNTRLDDERFIKGDNNLVDVLLKRQNIDGGFPEIKENNSNVATTEQAVIALAAAKKNDYPYKITQTLSKIKKQPVDEIMLTIEDITPYGVMLGLIAVIICMAVVSISFILKYKSRGNQKT